MPALYSLTWQIGNLIHSYAAVASDGAVVSSPLFRRQTSKIEVTKRVANKQIRLLNVNTPENLAYRGWAKFLNPESLRGNLIASSIFLTAYELLRTSIIDRIRDFFTYEFNESGGVISEDYKCKVLSLDKSPLRASLLWLQEVSAIDDTDVELVDEIRKHRNELAHDLPKFITNADAEININLLESIYKLLTKIDRWWIKEVDIPTNPDFDGQEVADDEIQSGTMICIQMMLRIATDENASTFWDEFQKQPVKFFEKVEQ